MHSSPSSIRTPSPDYLYKYLPKNLRIEYPRPNETKEVRFLLPLSPPPEESMAEERIESRPTRVVLPTAHKEEQVKLGSANRWGEAELRMLGVDFLRKQTIDLNNRVLKVRESDWPPELRERMCTDI
jgi:hypothetical protein